MPWPYISSRSRANSRSMASAAVDLDEGALTGIGDNSRQRGGEDIETEIHKRAASLDAPRSMDETTAVPPTSNNTSIISDLKKNKRSSSFPRLTLPTWRLTSTSTSTSSPQQQQRSSSSSQHNRKNSRRSLASSIASSSSRASSLHRQSFDNDDDDQDDLERNGVELQEGRGTPYSATGLKGGFQCITSSISNNGSVDCNSSIISSSSSTRRSANSNLFSSIFSSTGSSSRTSAMSGISDDISLDPTKGADMDMEGGNGNATISPGSSPSERHTRSPIPPLPPSSSLNRTLETADSGFVEFGPDSLIEEEEERRRRIANLKAIEASSSSHQLHTSAKPSTSYLDSSDGSTENNNNNNNKDTSSNVTIPKKARSRGWFSFSSNSSNAVPQVGAISNEDDLATPRVERDDPHRELSSISTSNSNATKLSTDVSLSSTLQGRTSASNDLDMRNGSTPNMPTGTTLSSVSIVETATVPAAATAAKKSKQGVSSKGISIIRNAAGRRRGDSEVSMKEMTNLGSSGVS